MPEEPEVPTRFVRVEKGGHVREFDFTPWPAQQPQQGRRPLRHLTYDDPPGMMITPDEYRAILAEKVREAGDMATFVESLTQILVRDLVEAHGCNPEEAIPAVMEFAAKVYMEFSGTV